MGRCKNCCIKYKQLNDDGVWKDEFKSLQANARSPGYGGYCIKYKQLDDGDVGEEKRVCRKSKTTRWLEVKKTHE